MTAPSVITFGCRLNAYESAAMATAAAGADNLIIVNTCAVTAEAERQARQAIRKARREHPDARIVVTGCSAQIAPERYADMTEVDQVVGNAEKLQPETWTRSADAPRILVNDIAAATETSPQLIEGFDGRTRAFIQVQNGCDHRCTFCVIPYGRGPSRSVPIGEIVRQVRTLTEAGFREVVLTGVDITSYGTDLPGRPALGQMIRRLLAQVPGLPRLRLSSLDPVEIDGDLWRLIGSEARLMPHLHLSLQAGDDLILKRMKRRHLRADAIALCRRARSLRPETVFGADLIAGFPTEDEAMFRRTLDIVDACDLTYLHVFPYSQRPDTPAARMPQVPKPVRRERAARLRAAGAAALDRHLTRRIGATVSVLTETGTFGRAEDFTPVALADPASPGQIVRVRLTARQGDSLQGRLAS